MIQLLQLPISYLNELASPTIPPLLVAKAILGPHLVPNNESRFVIIKSSMVTYLIPGGGLACRRQPRGRVLIPALQGARGRDRRLDRGMLPAEHPGAQFNCAFEIPFQNDSQKDIQNLLSSTRISKELLRAIQLSNFENPYEFWHFVTCPNYSS